MHVNPQIDSQVLFFHGMSEESVILHEDITLSQVDTDSAVGSGGTHFTISINLHVPLKRKLLCRWGRGVRIEFWNSLLLEILAKLMKMQGGRQTSTYIHKHEIEKIANSSYIDIIDKVYLF